MKNRKPLYSAFYNYTLCTLLFCMSVVACKHKEEIYLGAANKAASSDFIAGNICLVDISSSGIQGTSCNPSYQPIFGSVTPLRCYFNCDFNQEVTWTITITGQTSGAVKVITGTSAGLPFGNTESIWKGDASSFRFFKSGETCDVKIAFHGSTVVRTTTVTISNITNGALRYSDKAGVIALLDNMDNGGTTSFTYSYLDQGDDNRNSISLNRGSGSILPVEGNFMLKLNGQDANNNTYLGGTGPELLTSHAAKIRTVVPSGETDASQLYFNMYVYGTGLNNTCLQIRAYELDGLSNTATGPLPAYTSNEEIVNDQWAYDLYINWTGWKLISIPYSAFKPSNNPLKGGNGNRVKEPRKITGYNLLLQSMPNSGASVDTYVDFITLTWGKPFHTEPN